MSSHTVESYDKELSKLRSNIVDMANLVREMLIIADKSLQQEKNENFAELATITDEKINRFDSEIESKTIAILALRQPMAIDLREAIAALRLTVILERMGDLAKHISQRVDKISTHIGGDILAKIHQMSEINIARIGNVIKAYKLSDVSLAKKIFLQDREIDFIYTELMEQLEQTIQEFPQKTKAIMQIIYAIKNIERIGDYISKVATLVNYIISGDRRIHHD